MTATTNTFCLGFSKRRLDTTESRTLYLTGLCCIYQANSCAFIKSYLCPLPTFLAAEKALGSNLDLISCLENRMRTESLPHLS